MSLKQCPECEATVDEAKAYCPDCGTPMESEQKRVGSSEFDSLGQTQRLSKTTQFRLLEQFNLSSIFSPPPRGENESKAVENDVKVVQPSGSQQAQIKPKQLDNAAPKPEKVINLTAENQQKTGDASNPNKKLYFVLGVILLFFVLTLIGVIILGILFWNYK